MTDVMTAGVDTGRVKDRRSAPARPDAVVEQLVGRLVEQARANGLRLTGEGGLLQWLTKLVVESALDGEITGHLGYDKHDPADKNGGISRELAQWCGTVHNADWRRRYRAAGYGHLHIPRTTHYDGLRFEEVSLGYPREWRRRGGEPQPIRRVFKDQS
jgi:hypothetical protein